MKSKVQNEIKNETKLQFYDWRSKWSRNKIEDEINLLVKNRRKWRTKMVENDK